MNRDLQKTTGALQLAGDLGTLDWNWGSPRKAFRRMGCFSSSGAIFSIQPAICGCTKKLSVLQVRSRAGKNMEQDFSGEGHPEL